jgi:hypothetical protein
MKTLILLAALTLLSCKKETPQPNNLCECVDVTYRRAPADPNVWIEEVRTEPKQEDCWRHGETRQWTTNPVAWVTVHWKETKHCE